MKTNSSIGRILLLSFLFLALATLAACTGSNINGNSGNTAGLYDRIYVTDNLDVIQTVNAMMTIADNNYDPASPSASDTGTYGGQQFAINRALQLYDKNNAVVGAVNTPNDLSKYTENLTGYAGNVTFNLACTVSGISVSRYLQGSYLDYACAEKTTGNFTAGSASITFSSDLSVSYYINYASLTKSRTITGTSTLTFPDGWVVVINYEGSMAAGTISKNGDEQGSLVFSNSPGGNRPLDANGAEVFNKPVTNSVITLNDYECNGSVTLNRAAETLAPTLLVMTQYSGTWSGTWSLAQSGTISMQISPAGNISGTIFNTATGQNTALTGISNAAGDISAFYRFPGQNAFTLRGKISSYSTNKLKYAIVNSAAGADTAGTAEVTKAN